MKASEKVMRQEENKQKGRREKNQGEGEQEEAFE